MKKNTWTAYTVGDQKVRYANGTRPRANGIQITFTDSSVTPPARRQLTWRVNPGLQSNAEGARRKRERMLAEIADGAFSLAAHFDDYEDSAPTAAERAKPELFVGAIKQRLNEPHLAASTRKQYNGFVKEFSERWPTLEISAITDEHLREWMNDSKRKGVSIKTLRNKLEFIEPTMRRMARRGQIARNPLDWLDDIDFQPGQKEVLRRAVEASTERKIDTFDPQELKTIFAKMVGHSNRLEQAHNLTRLFLNGPRTGEGIAVAWDDVNWTKGPHGTVNICRSYTNNILGPRKNGKRVWVYEVELDEEGRRALERQKAFTYQMKPYQTGTDFGLQRFVFRNLETGHPLWMNDFEFRDRLWKTLLKNACVRYRSPYQLRHTCATYAISCGEKLEWVAQWKLGNSPATVRKHYAEWVNKYSEGDAGRKHGDGLNRMMAQIGGDQ